MYALVSLNVTVTLTFVPETPNSIGVIYYSHELPPYQIRISLDYEFSSYWSDKVCLRNDRQTDQRTERPISAKQYTPTSSKGA